MNNLLHRAAALGITTLIGLGNPGLGSTQTPAANPAIRDGQHDFDFNIGVWRTHIKRTLEPFDGNSQTIELDGTVTVRKVWDGKAQLEEIETEGPTGRWEGLTLFLYNPKAHQWSQNFANSKVGILSANVGQYQDGQIVLTGQDTINDKTVLVRGIWSNIKPASHQYEELYSADGGVSWMRSFIGNLTRLK